MQRVTPIYIGLPKSWCFHYLYRNPGMIPEVISALEFAGQQLDSLDEKWGKKYPVVIFSWRNNWAKLSTYFKYDPSIRKLIYTTNAIEGFHRQVGKVTMTKGAFPSDMAPLKLIYLAYSNIQKKWTSPLQNRSITVSQLAIWFEGRLRLTI